MSETVETWKQKTSKEIADCRVFKVREDFCERDGDGKEASFFVLENPDWINVIALTKDEQVILIEQFRHGTREITLEIPSGMVDENEKPKATAKRELSEETGFSSGNIVLIGKSKPNPAIQSNEMFHFLAVDCEKTGETDFDEHESIVTKLFPLEKVDELIETGKITHSLAIAAFWYFSIYNKKRR